MPEKLSFVIPCYHSEHTIADVLKEIEGWLKSNPNYAYEVIAVNDCSPDHVGDTLAALAASRPWLKVIELVNGGKHAAMMAGYRYATGDVIVNLDDDGQCPIDQLSLLLNELKTGADIALARYPKKKQSVFKNMGSKINEWMARILIKQPKNLQISNLSVLRRVMVKEILRYQNPYPYLNGLFLRSTSHIVNVDMEERERSAGVGHYTFRKSLSLWLNGFTAFSVKPLRISTLLGWIYFWAVYNCPQAFESSNACGIQLYNGGASFCGRHDYADAGSHRGICGEDLYQHQQFTAVCHPGNHQLRGGKRVKKYIFLYLTLALYSAVSIFSKLAGRQDFLSLPFILLYGIVLGILLLYAFLWQRILKMFPLTTAFSNKAVVIPLGMIWGALFFDETITVQMILGALVIIGGVLIIGNEAHE